MEFIGRKGVNILNAVVVSGVTNTERDEELIDCLKKYGSIAQYFMVDDLTSLFHKNLIIEFSTTAISALRPLLPYPY